MKRCKKIQIICLKTSIKRRDHTNRDERLKKYYISNSNLHNIFRFRENQHKARFKIDKQRIILIKIKRFKTFEQCIHATIVEDFELKS